MGATTIGAVSAPLVAGVQAMGMCGAAGAGAGRSCARWNSSIHQPRRNPKPSAWTLDRPQSRMLRLRPALGLAHGGELVRRPPIWSSEVGAVCITPAVIEALVGDPVDRAGVERRRRGGGGKRQGGGGGRKQGKQAHRDGNPPFDYRRSLEQDAARRGTGFRRTARRGSRPPPSCARGRRRWRPSACAISRPRRSGCGLPR